MTRRLLDTFAGAGGCSVGYARAGFEVTGVDIEPHPDYPYELIVADAMEVLTDRTFLDRFDVVHASPPCPRYSTATPVEARERHPDLVGPVREHLVEWGGSYVIENVPGAPMPNAAMLCGSSFGLRVRRHRLFESDQPIMSPGCWHDGQVVLGVYGDHPDRPGGWLRPDGTSRGLKATSIREAQEALGIDWMTRWDDLTDAIPPAYTEYLGGQLLDLLERAA
jgi:DNA (cytosine-5)-methyltransferase 1